LWPPFFLFYGQLAEETTMDIRGIKTSGGISVRRDGVELGVIKRSKWGCALIEGGKPVTPWRPSLAELWPLVTKRYERAR
jgi:hypothetical protein